MLEDRPILRERVLAASAISAVLIGGAMAMNTIITGGWQWGVASATTAAVYQDDINQQWSEPAPSVPVSQPVSLANASFANASDVRVATPEQAAASARGLDGASATVSLTSYKPPVTQTPDQVAQPPSPIDETAATARFNQIEADIRQANPQPDATVETDKN